MNAKEAERKVRLLSELNDEIRQEEENTRLMDVRIKRIEKKKGNAYIIFYSPLRSKKDITWTFTTMQLHLIEKIQVGKAYIVKSVQPANSKYWYWESVELITEN